MAGLGPSGLEIRTQAEIQELIEEKIDAIEPGVNLRAGPIQQLVDIVSEELATAWEALRGVYASQYPDGANGIALDQIAALTGTTRRAATRSRVTVSANLNPGVTLPAGSILAVDGDPDSQFQSVAAATNGGGSPADVDVVFEALSTGPVAALADTLTVIVTAVAGWNSATNPDDAEEGEDRADDVELRTTRAAQLPNGSRTIASIRSAVSRVEGIEQVTVFENVTMTTDGDGRPAKSIEAVLWDGDPFGADDDAIAQVIWDRHPDGIEIHGVGSSGTATDDVGDEHTVAFTRATKKRVYVDTTVVLAPGTAGGWVAQAQAAIAARGAQYKVGETAYASQFICALLEVPGVVAVETLTLGTAPSPVGTSVTADYDDIIRVDSGDVTAAEA
jgi:uncharacterized phage protein gp47/JayE